ncbi:MAG: beta-L-arabinofuranosidase domain-containing protein [Gemmatimonadales bacterium]
MQRRAFLVSSASVTALWPAASRLFAEGRSIGPDRIVARPFARSAVRLRPGPVLDAAEVNAIFFRAQDPDRLLHAFRLTAGLPTTAEPLGGWEAPENELRGHYTGHYLSTAALRYAVHDDIDARARADRMVAALAECQSALGGSYLSAFPEEFFDRLRNGQPVWAPWYTVHKIMAGLLDVHVYCGSAQALTVLRGMARWAARWAQPLGDFQMARVLEREYGGMNELLYNLSVVTGDESLRELAHRFDHERMFDPLAAGRDELKGLHANTLIPKIVGAARRYELTGEERYRRTAEFFWRQVTGARAYCTGGTSNGESWNTEPGQLGGELSGYTQEDCCTYNMLKLTRHLFGWTADAACAEYYERAFWNGIIGSQHPTDGSKLYYVPLASGYWKMFGTAGHDYWCCTGTMGESFASLTDGIYFHDDDGVWVNQFIASEVRWPEHGLRLEQETDFPASGAVRLTVRVPRPVRLSLRVRIPGWAGWGTVARLNSRALESSAAPGSYLVVDRTWKDGDTLSLQLPLALHSESLPGDPTQHALLYGPLVLAGRLGREGLTPETLRAEPTKPRTVPEYKLDAVAAPPLRFAADDPAATVRPVAGKPLTFEVDGQELVPFYRLFDERHAVYWSLKG